MPDWQEVSVAADIDINFCDPHAPWQRGSNENTNGLLRQYFPKGADLGTVTELELDNVADELASGSLLKNVEKARERGPSRLRRTALRLLRRYKLACTTTFPLVIFGGFGSAFSKFSWRTQLDATRVDSSAGASVSKKPTELKTPLPASIR
jgi:hypothetical protein